MVKNDFQYGGCNFYTLQCGMWLWDDMPLNSPKRPPYWNSVLVKYRTSPLSIIATNVNLGQSVWNADDLINPVAIIFFV